MRLKFFLFLLSVIQITEGAQEQATDQKKLFEEFERDSWKRKELIPNNEDSTIEKIVVNAFNRSDWGPGREKEEEISTEIKMDLGKNGSSGEYVLYKNGTSTNLSPRQFMRGLNLMEIQRFQKFLNSNKKLINEDNYLTDDLIKARALSGIFWVAKGDIACRVFSGMLIPGQACSENGQPTKTYQVHTCMHGFSLGNGSDGISYYFVPYGVMVDSRCQDDDYVVQKGFKVVSIKKKDAHEPISINNDENFKAGSGQNTKIDILYSQDDYAIATIEGKNGSQQSLEKVLKDTNNPIFENMDKLPVLNADYTNLSELDTETERLFVIGYSAEFGEDYGLVFSTTLDSSVYGERPIRSIRDDQNVKKPTSLQERKNEYYTSLATFPGISGAPVLRCKLGEDYSKKCSCIGTVFGAERKFTEGSNPEIDRFANFTNKI